MHPSRLLHFIIDLFVTLVLWCYFTFGYFFILFFLYIPVYISAKDRATALQNLNYIHLRCFFTLARLLIPRTKFKISDEVGKIHSSVIICNHISYLDPILLISLFPRQRTIVKHTFFRVPVFGWFLKNNGYISSGAGSMLGPAMINHLEDIKKHLASGGIIFVFPEGTRSRDGKLSEFNKGVFTIARYCNAPLKLIFITGTNRLLQPGRFLMNTHMHNQIKLELIGSLEPDYKSNTFSVSAVADQAVKIFKERIAKSEASLREQTQ